MSTELVTLRQRIRHLEDEAEIARRLAAFEQDGPRRERIYRFIQIEAANFPVVLLCQVCRVSRSAYYSWISRGVGPDEASLAEAYLTNRIYDIWLKSRGRYGVPRVAAQLWREGVQVNGKRVARLMAELGLAGISGRRKIHTTRRDPSHELAPDLVERDFTAEAPDQLWVGDITYIPTDEGFLYLASVLDVFSRRLLGWSMAEHLRTELCLDALQAASGTRGRVCFCGTVFHTDHGCQYTSELFNKTCQIIGIIQSMGSVGDSFDNAMAESFWSSLKRELVDHSFPTRDEARLAIFEWINWYNTERLHSSLGYMPPEEFEKSWHDRSVA